SGLAELRRRVMRERADRSYPVVYTTVVDLTGSPLPAGVRMGPWLSCTPDVSLDCIGLLDEAGLFVCWDAVAANHAPGRLEAMFAADARTLDRLAGSGEAWQGGGGRPGAVTGAERERILHSWNDTATPFPAGRLLHERVAAQAARRPDAIALRGRGWTR